MVSLCNLDTSCTASSNFKLFMNNSKVSISLFGKYISGLELNDAFVITTFDVMKIFCSLLGISALASDDVVIPNFWRLFLPVSVQLFGVAYTQYHILSCTFISYKFTYFVLRGEWYFGGFAGKYRLLSASTFVTNYVELLEWMLF